MSIQLKIKETREAIDSKSTEYRGIVEKGGFTDEIRADIEARKAELETLKKDLKTYEEAAEMEARSAVPVVVEVSNKGVEKEIRQFNLSKFLNEASSGKGLTGFEKEMHQEAMGEARSALKDTGAEVTDDGRYGIPQMVLSHMNGKFEKRAQSAGTNSEGGYAIQTDVGNMIEPLYPNPIVAQMGATVFDNLVGNVSLPKDTNLFSFAFAAENGASSSTSKTLSNVTMSPKRVTGYADISRRLLIQEKSQTMQSYLQAEFLKGINVAVDTAAINGSGAANNPTGLLNTSGVPVIVFGANGAAITWDLANRFIKELEKSDADTTNAKFLTTPGVKYLAKTTLKNATYGTNGYIWENDNTISGYQAFTSTTMPKNLTIGSSSLAHSMAFGNWADLLVGKWGGTFVLVDPYTQAGTSQVRIYCELQMDVAVRYTQSFAISKSVLTGLGS